MRRDQLLSPRNSRDISGGGLEGQLHDEATLVRRAREGDLDAYQVLVRMHQDAAVRLAATVSAGWGDPESVVQEAMVKAFHALGRLDARVPFRPWLYRIVINEARNARRAGLRRHRLVERVRREPVTAAVPSPESATVLADDQQQLLAAVRRLPPRQREAIACRYFLDLSVEETASVLHVARGTVKSRVSRALRQLRAELASGGTATTAKEER